MRILSDKVFDIQKTIVRHCFFWQGPILLAEASNKNAADRCEYFLKSSAGSMHGGLPRILSRSTGARVDFRCHFLEAEDLSRTRQAKET
mmetsp:Transcript_21105/g.52338  ORF Transcript_21105/g.52338 Transcript_21105/m.52338 type:complete len:89 (+) Transcript_21105:140-406(+)